MDKKKNDFNFFYKIKIINGTVVGSDYPFLKRSRFFDTDDYEFKTKAEAIFALGELMFKSAQDENVKEWTEIIGNVVKYKKNKDGELYFVAPVFSKSKFAYDYGIREKGRN